MGENSRIEIDIAHIAARQHGNITRLALLALGLDDAAIARRIRLGRLHRVHRGVYAVGRPPVTPLERAAAAVLACGPGAALSHHSALALWGFTKHWQTPFEVTVRGDRRPRGIRTHRQARLARQDVTTQRGVRVTTPARTVLDCTPTLSDKALKRTVNDARLSHHLRRSALADVIERFPHHRGARRLAPFLATTDGPTRSSLEDDFPSFCARHGLPRPVINARVAGYEVDALFEPEKLIVELDGWEFHSSRDAFEDDRDRDANTLAASYATIRITKRRAAADPEGEARRLHAILLSRRPWAA